MLRAPAEPDHVQPPLHVQGKKVWTSDGLLLLHFSIEWSPDVHQLADGRYVLRVGDRNAPFPAATIAALKATKAEALMERAVPEGSSIQSLDDQVVSLVTGQLGQNLNDTLLRYRLGEESGATGQITPDLVGLLVLASDPSRWHPRCGIDFIRWNGTERKTGSNLNIAKRERVEFPLAVLIERAYGVIRPHIRERQQLQDLFFAERMEYPTFVWQEALVNAVAHRDYSVRGASIEFSCLTITLRLGVRASRLTRSQWMP